MRVILVVHITVLDRRTLTIIKLLQSTIFVDRCASRVTVSMALELQSTFLLTSLDRVGSWQRMTVVHKVDVVFLLLLFGRRFSTLITLLG